MDYVLLDWWEFLDIINACGFMVDFSSLEEKIENYKGDNILLATYWEKQYGQDWYFCTTTVSGCF